MVAASPAISTTLNVPVGLWASELFHPYYAFTEVGYAVTIASPKGGKIEVNKDSDPSDPGGYSAHDVLSLGYLTATSTSALLDSTLKLDTIDQADYDAIVVCGGQGPMFQFRGDESLKALLAAFYEAEKPTAALCHGVSALIDVTLSDGSYLIAGKTMTGFANVEEAFADNWVGKQVMPWHIEDAAKERGANYIQAGMWVPFAIRDGRLITGQQQYSGMKTAELVIAALGV